MNAKYRATFGLWDSLAIALLLILMALTLHNLNADPYWVDEVIAVQRAGLTTYETDSSITAIWQRTALISDQVPGYYILLAKWAGAVGNTPFTGRLLSLLIGIICVSLVYQLGKRLSDSQAGFAAAVVLASSAFFTLFLHEMRMYALLICLISLMLWCYWLVTHGYQTWWSQVGLVMSTAMLMYTYYLSIVMIAAVCTYHLIFAKKNREWWRVPILMVIAGLLFLPWLLTSFSVFEDTYRNEIRQMFTQSRVDAIEAVAEAFSNTNTLFLALILLFAMQWRKESHRFAWFILFVALSLMLILNPWFGVLVNLRYMLMLWIPLALLSGLGIREIVRRGIPASLIFGLIAVVGILYILDPSVAESYDLPIRYLPWDALVETIQPHEQEGDVLTFLVSIEDNDWEGVHEQRVMPHYFHDSVVEPVFLEDVRNLPDEGFLNEVRQLTQDVDRIWFAYPKKLPSWRNGMLTDFYRDQGYIHCGIFADTPELYTDLYVHQRLMKSDNSVRFSLNKGETSAQMLSVNSLPQSSTETITLLHTWQLDETFPRHTYSLAVHLVDANGRLLQQYDYGVPTDSFSCVKTDIDVSTLAPGQYTIQVFMYAWQDGTRITDVSPVPNENGVIVLGTFTSN